MIIVHARGNSKIGIGNLSRSYELIKYLSMFMDVVGIFECEKNIFLKYEENNIFHSKKLDDSIKIIESLKCTIYVCDLVDPDEFFSDKLKKLHVKKIIYFNSLEYGFKPDILFIMDGFDYNIEAKEIEIYRGFEYYIVGKNIVKNRKKYFNNLKSIKNILICFGGADPAFYTEYFAEIITDKKYNYTIVLGPAMQKNRKDYIKNIKKDNITYIDNPTDMIQLYLSHDILVTLGGMMTYEAMCLGLPACAIRWEYLAYVVKSFGEKNMINDLGNIDDSYKNLLNLDITEVNQIALNSFHIIDGSALDNIKRVIEKIIK